MVLVLQSRLSGSQGLLGWDSVMPELDWKLNFGRALAGMWQEYQGVGLTGGMAHLADLSRMIILWAINWVVPKQYVRWVWHVGMLVLGPVGVWYLGKKLWKWSENACLAASIFYLLNLATIQYFFVPYEAFSSFYGFLPWLIAVFLTYLETGTKKDLGKVALMGILATSAFYVQTLFVVYAMTIGVLSLGNLKQWKRILVGTLTVLGVNSFWLLPIVYGVINGGGQVGLAKINSVASPETALMNSAFGNWQNVTLLKGYWLEYIEWVGGSQWGRLMQSWWEWSRQGWMMWIGWGLFGVSVLGSLIGIVKRKMKWGWLAGLLLAYIMVASFSAPFGIIYQYLVDIIPLFGEMFRSVYTKWSVVLALFVSVGLGSIVASVKNKWLAGIMTSLILICCLGVVWPVFKTGIFFDKMKVELPGKYSKMFEFMKSQPKDVRVAYMPAQDMWSWKYTDWGYRGSGFLWYGIEQPTLDRAFDVWSPYNEGFYDEFSTALYGCENNSQIINSQILKLNCGEQVAQVLEKYDVRYVLLDESVIAPGQDKEILRIDETKKMMEEIGAKQVFKDGFLTVWDMGSRGDQFVSAPSSYTMADGDNSKVRKDVIYGQNGTYVQSQSSDHSPITAQGSELEGHGQVVYPFAGIMREEVKGVEYGDRVTTLRSDLVDVRASHVSPLQIQIPGWKVGDIVRVNFANNEALPAYSVNGQDGPKFLGKEKPDEGMNYLVARVSEGEEWSEYLQDARFQILDSSIKVEVAGEPMVYDFGTEGQKDITNCDVLKRGVAEKNSQIVNSQILKLGQTQYMANERGAACDYIAMKELDSRLSYLMRVQGENREGRSLKYFLYNTGSKRNDIEYLLGKGKFDQTFGLLPWSWDGYYTLNIETRSFGQRAENVIAPVEVRWFPIEQIAGARIVPIRSDLPAVESAGWDQPLRSDLRIAEVKKAGTWLYRVKVEGRGLLKLSQGYDAGWIAPPIRHVKVDGWANGWIIDHSGEITIFYWPQLLEYFGFGILGVTIWLFWRK